MSRTEGYANGVWYPEAGRSVGISPIGADSAEPGILYYDTAENDNTLYYWDAVRSLYLTVAREEMLFLHNAGGSAPLQLQMVTPAFTTSEGANIGFPATRRMVVTDLACIMPAGGPFTCSLQVRSQAFGGAAATVGQLNLAAQNINSSVTVNSANRVASNDVVTARVSSGTAGATFLRVGLRGYHEAP